MKSALQFWKKFLRGPAGGRAQFRQGTFSGLRDGLGNFFDVSRLAAFAAKWNRRLAQAIEQIQPIWNPDRIYLGGGNAKHVTIDLPPHIQIASNTAGLLGGIALWDGREGIELSKAEKATKTTHAGSLTPTNR